MDAAGTNYNADHLLTAKLLEWADVIFVIETAHRSKAAVALSGGTPGKDVVCLDIPDEYKFMQPELVRLL